VSAAQRKSHRRVIEFRVQPAVGSVAGVAVGRKIAGDMIRASDCFEFRGVAGNALRGHRLESTGGRSLMTGIAVYRGVGPGQGEAIVVLLNLLDRNLPSSDGVALLAIRSQLPPVNVSMAILAPLPNIGEHRLDVALNAAHCVVQSPQRIVRLIVIEFGNRTNRFPRARGVAVLAR
jgi:hypothetical protein